MPGVRRSSLCRPLRGPQLFYALSLPQGDCPPPPPERNLPFLHFNFRCSRYVTSSVHALLARLMYYHFFLVADPPGGPPSGRKFFLRIPVHCCFLPDFSGWCKLAPHAAGTLLPALTKMWRKSESLPPSWRCQPHTRSAQSGPTHFFSSWFGFFFLLVPPPLPLPQEVQLPEV